MEPFIGNIIQLALDNQSYRKLLRLVIILK